MTTPEPAAVVLWLDGQPIQTCAGRSVAIALLIAGHQDALGTGTVFCGMGSCYGCVATIDGRPATRTCLTPVEDGMRINPRQGGRS